MTEEKENKLKLNLRKRDGKTARPAVAKDEDDFEENTEGRTPRWFYSPDASNSVPPFPK